MTDKDQLKEFGRFLLKHLNVIINIEQLDWDIIYSHYEKFKEDKKIYEQPEQVRVRRPGLMYINWFVANYFGFDSLLVQTLKTRKREITKARQVGHYISVKIFKYTQEEVTEFYDYMKQRSTIHHSIKAVENDMETNAEYKEEILTLISRITKKTNYNEH